MACQISRASGPVIAILFCTGSNTLAHPWHNDLEIDLTPAVEEYCHIVKFPEAWVMPPAPDNAENDVFDSIFSEYEFRIEGLQGTEFLIGGFTELFPPRLYTSNQFRLDLSNPAEPVRRATREAWNAGTVVRTSRRSVLIPGPVPPNNRIDFNGFQFKPSGEFLAQLYDAATMISPDQAWLVLQSRARKGDDDGPTNVHFDLFDADMGRELVTIEGTFSTLGGDVDGALSKSGWVTERYFIVPLGRLLEKFMVCDFGERAKRESK